MDAIVEPRPAAKKGQSVLGRLWRSDSLVEPDFSKFCDQYIKPVFAEGLAHDIYEMVADLRRARASDQTICSAVVRMISDAVKASERGPQLGL